MNVGDLVEHAPDGSTVERILRKLSSGEIDPDFVLGVVVEQKNKGVEFFHTSSQVFTGTTNQN